MEENKNTNIKTYPKGLLDWAGHKRGGVKKPFDKNSGRPNGEVIKTQLTQKIDEWIKMPKDERPRIILLIGGPGNGKTDALEYLINQLDTHYNANYFEKIENELKKSEDIVPRTISIPLDSSHFEQTTLEIIQDASTGNNNASSQKCLINDLNSALRENKIYIACVNRGILAEAVSLAQKENTEVYNLLNKIISGITENIKPIPLWPLRSFDKNGSLAIWPMDIESLVRPLEKIEETPVYQILTNALDEKKWKCDECNVQKNLCPFYQNKVSLINKEKRSGFLQLLYDYEIINNKRWSFREIFSLISYIIVGTEHEFGGKEPCDWTKIKIEETYSNDDKIRVRAVWELNDHLYHFRLFNHWPSFNPIARSSNSEIKKIFDISPVTKEFFNYFSYVRTRKYYKPDIANIIDNDFYNTIDPGQANIREIHKGDLSIFKIESSFSYSVSSGIELTNKHIGSLENRLFKQLIFIEDDLDNNVRFEPSVSSAKVDELLFLIRMIAARYFKRIYFSSEGISKDEEYLIAYRDLNFESDPDFGKLKKVKKLFDRLIQDNSRLTVVLNSSLSQPQLSDDLKIKLKVNRVQIKQQYIEDIHKDVPRLKLKLFSIDFGEKLNIQLSYQLYKALCLLNDGVRQASLPKEVLAMIDNIKSKISGHLVRDEDRLINSIIEIGNSKWNYRIDDLEQTIELTKQSTN